MEGEEGIPLLESLKETIRRMGVKEFSQKAKLVANNVSRMLNGHVVPTVQTIDRYLQLFGLRAKLIVEEVA